MSAAATGTGTAPAVAASPPSGGGGGAWAAAAVLVDEGAALVAAPVAAATAAASSEAAAAAVAPAAVAGAVVEAGSAPIELQPAPPLLRWLEPTEVAVHTPPLLTLPLLTLLLNRTPDVFFDSRRRKIGLWLSSSREAAAGAGTASGGAVA